MKWILDGELVVHIRGTMHLSVPFGGYRRDSRTVKCSTFHSVHVPPTQAQPMAPARRPKIKTATLTVRIDPVIKAAAEAAAVLERRSLTGLLEVLILNHCRTLGISPDSSAKESRQ